MGAILFFDDALPPAAKANYQQLRTLATTFLAKLHRYGNEVFDCSERASRAKPSHVERGLLPLARHNLAYLDAVIVLLQAGCVEACDPLLRSQLEAAFGIAYIAEGRHEERALAYQLSRYMRKVKELRQGDVTHELGAKLHAHLSDDEMTPGILTRLPANLSEKADELERRIAAEPALAPILAEWQRHKKEPHWYSLFGGPPNVRALAKYLKWQSLYQFFYSDWSNAAHAGSATETFETADQELRPFRFPAGFMKVVALSYGVSVRWYDKLAGFYNPEMAEQVRKYTVGELEPHYQELTRTVGGRLKDIR